jgi:hypothetical protein
VHPRTLTVQSVAVFSVLALCALPSLAAPQTPFPVDKNRRLEDTDDTFTVKGRMRIPRRLSIEAMRAITIQGEGDDATLEISGKVKMRAATGGKIVFRDVWVELTPECREISLANCIFKGRGGIRPSPDGPCAAKISLEGLESDRGVSITIEASGGSILMDGCFLDGPLVLRGVPKSEKGKSSLTISVYGSTGEVERRRRGLFGGITIEGVKDGTIRTCDIAGREALFIDNRKLALDGNNLRSDRVEFRSTVGVKFSGLKITKTDFRADKLVLSAPMQGKKTGRLTFETCYFRGLEDPETIRKEMLRDSKNSESGVVAVLRDIREKPLGLAGNEK